MQEGVAARRQVGQVVGGQAQLVQVEVLHPSIRQGVQKPLEPGQFLGNGGNLHGHCRDHAGGMAQGIEAIAGGADIEADLVEASIP